MSILKDTIIELNLTEEQLKDKEIRDFVMQVAFRKSSNNWVQYWNGNGFIELNKNDGTLITTVITDEEFKPEFPLNMDMEISNMCTNGCSFCYAGCTPNGKHADIKKFIENKDSFLYSIHEGTELALNGNEPLHPDLELLLQFCKDRNIFANLTVQENTLLKHKDQLEEWLDKGLIHGIGISPCKFSNEMIEFCQNHSTAVIHTIAGITTMFEYNVLKDKGIKILILGYKDFGRGIDYKETHTEINNKIQELSENIQDFIKHFNVVSFDNLAIQQLNPKKFLTDEQWNKFYRGDDGHHTLFVDLVNETFAKNSMQTKENHIPLTNDVRTMLKEIQKRG